MIPEEKNTTAPYFHNAARELVQAVILALNQSAGPHWTFRDLLCALDSKDHISAVTARHALAKRSAARILDDDKHAQGVISTLGTKLGPFAELAALWHTCPSRRRFSVAQFLERPGILILGNDPVLQESLWPMNAILLKALTHEILRRPEARPPRYWFVLDEFAAMKQVDCIHELLNRGRSKGASVLIGAQSVESLIQIYGEHGANDLLSQCGHKTILRAGGPKTAEWAESCFGKIRRIEEVWSTTWGGKNSSVSVQRSLQDRPLFLASFFASLPYPRPGKLYISVSEVPSLPYAVISRWSFDKLLSWCVPPAHLPALQPRRNRADQNLVPWNEDEERFYCGADKAAPAAQSDPAHKPPTLPKPRPRKDPP